MINYESMINTSLHSIKPSGIGKFFSMAASMPDAIVLGVGEPDFKTPWRVRQAAIQSLEKGKTWYTPGDGMNSLKKAICDYQKRRFNLDYNTDEVMVTIGGSEGIDLCFRTLLNPGDEVIVPTPCYVSYEPIAKLCQAKMIEIRTRQEDEFKITPEQLKAAITDKTKMLVLPYPANPTGAIMEREDLQAIADILKDTDILVMTDEIYAELTFGSNKHISFGNIEGMKERTIIINGFSKAYAMTGWRLGYLLAPKPLLDYMSNLHQFAIICAPTTSQYAAVVAMNECDDEIEEMREQYNMRRRLLIAQLNDIGIPCYNAKGAFYIFADIRSTGLSSEDFCEQLLMKQKVVVIPGNAFGDAGEGFVRISYSYSLDHLQKAIPRIEKFIKSLKKD